MLDYTFKIRGYIKEVMKSRPGLSTSDGYKIKKLENLEKKVIT